MKYNILITEDEREIAELIKLYLENESYRVFCAEDGKEALELLEQESIDMAILDIMMPGMDGYELTKRIRKRSNMPILILSAKTQSCDKIRGLNLGADDYMTKPFYTRELLARIAVHLRTFDSFAKSEILTFEEIKLNIDTHIAQIKDVEIKLTRTEYAILKLLMQNQTQVVSKSHLLDHISEDTPDCTESSLKTHISNLRKKLRAVNGKEYIEAVWGIGFKMKEE